MVIKSQLFEIDVWQSLKVIFEWAWGFAKFIIKLLISIIPWWVWVIICVLILFKIIFERLIPDWIDKWKNKKNKTK
jgi:hypothetical protein